MIYDKETNRHYLTDSHLKNSKALEEEMKDWQKHFPLSREEVFEQVRKWNTRNYTGVKIGR